MSLSHCSSFLLLLVLLCRTLSITSRFGILSSPRSPTPTVSKASPAPLTHSHVHPLLPRPWASVHTSSDRQHRPHTGTREYVTRSASSSGHFRLIHYVLVFPGVSHPHSSSSAHPPPFTLPNIPFCPLLADLHLPRTYTHSVILVNQGRGAGRGMDIHLTCLAADPSCSLPILPHPTPPSTEHSFFVTYTVRPYAANEELQAQALNLRSERRGCDAMYGRMDGTESGRRDPRSMHAS
ncbi:hypothetical protein R3P38DRAFT_3215386 [Favolaschia claudopus]|uniref:Uncharacterized protein n=1 Tax=Favolaschia claudopus TaxID=2862362 RepID=A0AAW0A957_9AGAR